MTRSGGRENDQGSHDRPILRNQADRNFRLGVINGFTYNIGETLFDPTLVLVSYLSNLTNSPLLLGLIVPIRDAAWALPQLWLTGIVQSYRKKIEFFTKTAYLRIFAFGVLVGVMYYVRNRTLLLPLFFVVFTVASLLNSLGGLSFLSVVGKTIPDSLRGKYFSLRLGLGGLFGFGASFFVRWILGVQSPLKFPENYALLAGLFFLFVAIALLVFTQVSEPDEEIPLFLKSSKDQFLRAYSAFKRDRKFKRLILNQSFLILGGLATPFFAVIVQKEFDASVSMIGIYLAMVTIAGLVSNYLLGKYSWDWGYARVMGIAAISGIGMTTLVLILLVSSLFFSISSKLASIWLIPVFILLGIRNACYGVGGNSILLEVAPITDRVLYVGFTNTVLGVALLLTGLSGVVVYFWGYFTLVIIAICMNFVALTQTKV